MEIIEKAGRREIIEKIKSKNAFISDMDGVIYHGNKLRIALKKLGCSREDSIIIGDRMDTDIIAGIESEIDTLLVLSGISTLKSADKFPYRPHYILEGVFELVS